VLASGRHEHVPYRDSSLTWLLKDAITGSSARVCMVAAVHPAHEVETASTLRYARQYSALQSTTASAVPQLSKHARDQQRKVDALRVAFEQALAGSDGHGIQWTRESLQGSVHCQPRANAKSFFEGHPHATWTSAHQSKAAVRGSRKNADGVGFITATSDAPAEGGDAGKGKRKRAKRPGAKRTSKMKREKRAAAKAARRPDDEGEEDDETTEDQH